jgi:hypothetical protein
MASFLGSHFNVSNSELYHINFLSEMKIEKFKPGVEIGVIFHVKSRQHILGEISLKTSEMKAFDDIYINTIIAYKKTRDHTYLIVEHNDLQNIRTHIEDFSFSQPRIKFEDTDTSSALSSPSHSKACFFVKEIVIDKMNKLDKDVTIDTSFAQSAIMSKKSLDFRSLDSSYKASGIYKTLKKRVKATQSSIKRKMRFFKLSMIIGYIVQIIIGFLLFHFLKDTSIQNIQDTSILNHYNLMRYEARLATYKSKLLYAYDNGIPLDNNREQLVQDILTVGSKMHNYTLDILNEDFDSEIDSVLRNDVFIWWSYREGEYYSIEMNNIDIPKRYVTLIYDLAYTNPVTNTTTSFMELYRNTEGESLGGFNKTSNFLVREYYIKSEAFTNQIIAIFNSMLAAIYVFEFILIFCILLSLNKTRKIIWKMIFAVTKTSLQLGITRLKERLLDLHREEVELEYSTDSKRASKSYHTQHRYQISVYILMMVLLCLMLLLIIYPTFIISPKILGYLKLESDLLNWNGESMCLIMKTFFILQETVLLPNILKTNIYAYDNIVELDKNFNYLHYSESVFVQSIKLSETIENFYFESVGDGMLHKGFKSAINEYIMMLQDYQHISLKTPNIAITNLSSLFNTMQKLSDVSYSFHTIFQDDLQKSVEDTLNTMLNFIIALLISIGILSFIVIFPLLGAFSRVLLEECQVILCIPREDPQI